MRMTPTTGMPSDVEIAAGAALSSASCLSRASRCDWRSLIWVPCVAITLRSSSAWALSRAS